MSPRSSSATEEAPLRHFPLYPTLPRGRHRPFPRFENRGRPFPTGSPSAPRPMGCRFRGPLLGEIVSPRLIGSLCLGIPPASALPPMPLGGGPRLGTPALPPPRPAVRRWPPPSPSGAVRNGPYRTLFCFFPLRGGGRSEIAPSSAFAVPWSMGSGKLGGGHDRTETGPISVFQRGGRPPLGPSLSLVSSHVGGASLAHRSGPLSALR